VFTFLPTIVLHQADTGCPLDTFFYKRVIVEILGHSLRTLFGATKEEKRSFPGRRKEEKKEVQVESAGKLVNVKRRREGGRTTASTPTS
jgi:hypothetical protein